MRVKVNPLRAIVAGFIACLAMMLTMYTLPFIGAPRLNLFALLSTLTADYYSWAQPLEYLSLGVVVFPLLYSVLFYDGLAGRRPWQKGLTWGLILWFVRGLVVAPIMGEGIFSLSQPFAIAALIETLIAHLIYGLLLGLLAGERKPAVRPVSNRFPQSLRR